MKVIEYFNYPVHIAERIIKITFGNIFKHD